MTASVLSTIQDKLQDRLLEQARDDLRAGALEACGAKLDLLLKDVSGARAAATLCLRLLRALAADAAAEAANLAYYLAGGVAAETRRAVLADELARLADWPPLAPWLDRYGARRDPERLIAQLAAVALPRSMPSPAMPAAAAASAEAAP